MPPMSLKPSPARASAPAPASTTRTGSCLCQAVKYQVTGDPLTFRVCHCQNCRKATGSAFMSNGFFNDEQVRVLQGQEKLKIYADGDTESGVPLNRYFCTECGSNVFLRSASKENDEVHKVHIVALGTLDGDFDWKPRKELWPELRRHWVSGIERQQKPRSAKL